MGTVDAADAVVSPSAEDTVSLFYFSFIRMAQQFMAYSTGPTNQWTSVSPTLPNFKIMDREYCYNYKKVV